MGIYEKGSCVSSEFLHHRPVAGQERGSDCRIGVDGLHCRPVAAQLRHQFGLVLRRLGRLEIEHPPLARIVTILALHQTIQAQRSPFDSAIPSSTPLAENVLALARPSALAASSKVCQRCGSPPWITLHLWQPAWSPLINRRKLFKQTEPLLLQHRKT